MARVTITLDLPDELADKIEESDLLKQNQLVEWVEQRLKREIGLKALSEMSQKLADADIGLTEEEILEEVRAVREERKQQRHASRT
jgi:uncharacterized protein YjiS (DUF1127 family)